MSNPPPTPPPIPNTVPHDPPHWHHHTMTPVISSTPVITPAHPPHHHHQHHTINHPQLKLPYTIRPGTETDLPAIHKIYTYYVLNSALSFLVHAPDIGYLKKGYEASISRKMPYLVAVTHVKATTVDVGSGSVGSGEVPDDSTAVTDVDQNQNTTQRVPSDATEVLLGYAHVVPFSEKAGYGPSVELTMYLHPSYLTFGIGSTLLSTLETSLRHNPIVVFEPGFEEECVGRFADVIVVRASDDVEGDFEGVRMGRDGDGDGGQWPVWKARGERNREWYLRKGFEEVGRMRRVGEKFGRRVDVIILQKFLGTP